VYIKSVYFPDLGLNLELPFPLPLPMPMEVGGEYVSGFDLSLEMLESLGTGTFTIEILNNFNIATTTITIIDTRG